MQARNIWGLLLFAVAAGACAGVQQPAEPEKPVAVAKRPTPLEPPRVTVDGDIPASLAGTWLIVDHQRSPLNLSFGRKPGDPKPPPSWHTQLAGLRLNRDAEGWSATLFTIKAQGAVGEAYKKAAAAGTRFVPSAGDVTALGADRGWWTPRESGLQRISLGPPNKGPRAKQPDAALRFGFLFGGFAPVWKEAVVYFMKEIEPERIAGASQTTVVSLPSVRPTLVPISVEGEFVMLRLE